VVLRETFLPVLLRELGRNDVQEEGLQADTGEVRSDAASHHAGAEHSNAFDLRAMITP